MATRCACGAQARARSASTCWHTTTSASAGMLSTLVLVTVRSGRSALMRLRNLVAPIADEPMPASHAKTTFLTAPPSASGAAAAGAAVPLASAFICCILPCASSRLLAPAILTIGDAMTNETAAASTTPIRLVIMLSRGDIIRNAIMDPGAAGPFRPAFMMEKNRIAQALPTIGAMMTTGFIRMYGK